MSDIEVHMGQIAAAESEHNLVTSGVGSCLVITLYDPKLQIGALAHAMIPIQAKRDAEYQHHEIFRPIKARFLTTHNFIFYP